MSSLDIDETTAEAWLIENGAISRGRRTKQTIASAGTISSDEASELLRVPRSTSPRSGPAAEASPGSTREAASRSSAERGRRARAHLLRPRRSRADGDGREHHAQLHANRPDRRRPDRQFHGARRRSGSTVTEPLSLSVVEGARRIGGLGNARMIRALRSVSSEKGRDPRDFALLAYGGTGPIHAAGLAEELGVTTVLVPPVAGFFSAIGLLFARQEFHDVRTCRLDARSWTRG